MKKLNNKGFAISGILYSIMVLFLMLLLSILGILGSRKATLDKSKKDVLESLNSKYANSSFNFKHRDITIINRDNKDDIMYALMDGVTAIDENGNSIDKSNISYDLDINNLENKDYIVTYTTSSNNQNIIGTRKIRFIDNDIVNTFLYTGDEQVFSASNNGSYKVELWGASGGSMTGEGFDYNNNSRGNLTYTGGKGAYTRGNVILSKNQTMYVYVGGKGADNQTHLCIEGNAGGYNGGGSLYEPDQWCKYGSSGGGATDVRLVNGSWDDFNSLKSRIMVAAGGGGASFRNYGYGEGNGGAGGGLVGLTGSETTMVGGFHRPDYEYGYVIGTGGNQTCGGKRKRIALDGVELLEEGKWWDISQGIADFGVQTDVYMAGGGSGYYAGGSGFQGGAGGGSSFISGHDGCDAIAESSTSDNIIHTGQSVHYTGYKFENSIMLAGNESMPEHRGNGTMIGNIGNGYAKISLIYYY